MKLKIVKFSDLGIAFKSRREGIMLSLIVAAGVLALGCVLYGADAGVTAIINYAIH